MKKISINEGIAVISSFGMTAWLISDFFGGMFLYAFAFMIVILPVLLLYLYSVAETIIAIIRKKKLKIRLAAHAMYLFSVAFISIYHAEFWRSDPILKATMPDDFTAFEMILRKDGSFQHNIHGIFFYSDVFRGEYVIDQDTLIFLDPVYDNDFIPDTMLISKQDKALFISRDQSGNFDTDPEWLNHFKISFHDEQ